MQHNIGKKLLDRYINDSASEKERLIVEKWYAQRLLANTKELEGEDYQRIKTEIWASLAPKKLVFTYRTRLWPKLAAAAAVLIALTTVVFILQVDTRKGINQTVSETDIRPGRIGATLTLSDGRRINVTDKNDGKLAHELNISINKSKDGQLIYQVIKQKEHRNEITPVFNTLTTSRGETYMIVLSDNSKVWLNAASSLSFSADLTRGGVRKVKLKGEGYFEIAKDKAHPFIVETAKQQVEVLGTHFNINSYNNEDGVKTTLLEGAVKIKAGSSILNLKPGQESINNGYELKVQPADTELAVAWKNGYFKFNDRLEVIMTKIAYWYNVDIEFAADAPKEVRLWGYISRSNTLSKVLRHLEQTKKVRFEMKGRKVIVRKNENQ